MTSRAAGSRVARMFGFKKFGHLGTLDPMASGVLPIALGEATKMIPYLENRKSGVGSRESFEKEYLFSICRGIETDTWDITGNIVKTTPDSRLPTYEQLSAACAKFVGDIEQVPPAYSAVHVNGRRAYELARKGIAFEMPKRKVKIYSLICDDVGFFRVCCSPGTYVRSLARDIAKECGSLATCCTIGRMRTHGFSIENTETLDFLENLYNNDPRSVAEYLKPIDFGLDDILVTELNENDAKVFKNGGFIQLAISNEQLAIDNLRRVYSNERFIGIGEIENGMLKPRRVINQ